MAVLDLQGKLHTWQDMVNNLVNLHYNKQFWHKLTVVIFQWLQLKARYESLEKKYNMALTDYANKGKVPANETSQFSGEVDRRLYLESIFKMQINIRNKQVSLFFCPSAVMLSFMLFESNIRQFQRALLTWASITLSFMLFKSDVRQFKRALQLNILQCSIIDYRPFFPSKYH